jgi:isoprenylcysteine carboxyl methyltransferase (ICMT) family protein YpbQ
LLAAGREAMPLMGTAMCLFFLAALIEGFVSPSALHWTIKAGVGLISALLLMFYFVLLGYPRKRSDGTG